MSTARSLITNSLKELRVYAPGQTVDDDDLADGLTQLNLLLEYLSNDAAACYAILEQSLTLTVSQSQYTLGTGGDLSVRPIRLIYGPGAAYVLDSNNVRYGVDVWPQDRWNEIGYTQTNADYPSVIFYDPQYPLAYLNVFPIPTMAYTLKFDSYLQLASLVNYAATITFPPGYEGMLQHNLTVWLAPWYKNAQLNPMIEKLALRTLNSVKRMNRRQNMADYDPELLPRAQASYNVYTGSYTR